MRNTLFTAIPILDIRVGGSQYPLAEHEETTGIRISDRANPINCKFSEEETT